MSELSPQGGSEGYGACDDEVRVERCGKSAPDGWRLSVAVNSIRSNTGMGAGGPTPKAGPAVPGVAGAYRQRCVEIDDCLIQNPAYSLARTRGVQALAWTPLVLLLSEPLALKTVD